MDLSILKNDEMFVDFFCLKEDKWLQNAELETKLLAIFGNLETVIKEFEIYKRENGQ